MNAAIVVAIVILAIVAAIMAPMIFLWCVNTLAAAGGSSFYVPHSFMTYTASLGIMMLIGGSAKASSK